MSQGLAFGLSSLGATTAYKRQKEFAKKAVRWRMKDMKAGGINPILAVVPGGGAGAPSVVAARPGQKADFIGGAKKGQQFKREQRILASVEQKAFNDAGTSGQLWNKAGSDARRAGAENLRSQIGLESDADHLTILRSNLPSARAIHQFDSSELGQRLIKWKRGAGEALQPLGAATGGFLGGVIGGAVRRGRRRPGGRRR